MVYRQSFIVFLNAYTSVPRSTLRERHSRRPQGALYKACTLGTRSFLLPLTKAINHFLYKLCRFFVTLLQSVEPRIHANRFGTRDWSSERVTKIRRRRIRPPTPLPTKNNRRDLAILRELPQTPYTWSPTGPSQTHSELREQASGRVSLL